MAVEEDEAGLSLPSSDGVLGCKVVPTATAGALLP